MSDILEELSKISKEDIEKALEKACKNAKKEEYKPIVGGIIPSCDCPCNKDIEEALGYDK